MLDRMPGNDWEKFANLRAYYGFMWGHPGKKLLFMGQEFAQTHEWNHDTRSTGTAAAPGHAGMQPLVRDLNRLYRGHPALHVQDCDPDGFQWIEADDAERSVFAWIRRGNPGDPEVVVICNFTPQPSGRLSHRDADAGRWREVLNTDAAALWRRRSRQRRMSRPLPNRPTDRRPRPRWCCRRCPRYS